MGAAATSEDACPVNLLSSTDHSVLSQWISILILKLDVLMDHYIHLKLSTSFGVGYMKYQNPAAPIYMYIPYTFLAHPDLSATIFCLPLAQCPGCM